ncbi:hypothetical protein [Nonomuraea sp. SYSU D8015]|uniref:hypothetical protein n=1 Tax=Nonomuraea sp. SYSU D8015 TaxID=2593644 RepID=UPI001660FE10|nr:hypothetical protein [Nonomuraea sp. SYSU D8015]
MNVNLDLIPGFLATHGRVLDRRRYDHLMGDGDPACVLAALDAYRNPDGGYGWGLEPDLRSPESQPGSALHAFEVFEDVAPHTSQRAVELCDWLEGITLPDGGLPFALPLTITDGTAPWWGGADRNVSSLQITAVTAAAAHRVAAHDAAVAAHPWLAKATRYCLDAIQALEEQPHAYVLSFAVRFLDSVYDTQPRAADLLKRLGAFIPADGRVPVEGGTEDEALRPLDFAPHPGRPVRDLFAPEVVGAELTRLAAGQRDDGGWTVEYARISPAGSLDWRGAITVHAVQVLRANGVI